MNEEKIQLVNGEDTPDIRLSIISDIHICGEPHKYNENFEQAIRELNQVNPYADALCIVGDMTESGKDKEYDELNKWIQVGNQKETYMILGNHDVRWLEGGYEEAYNRFLMHSGMPEAYFDQWINGYHLVFLATSQDLKDQATLAEEQLEWLKNKLAEAVDDKPILVFLHQSIVDTSAGSYTTTGYTKWYPDGVAEGERLKQILEECPQVIFFTGHTHAVLEHPKTVYKKQGIHYVNTGSVAYTIPTEGYGEAESSQGLCVEIYNKKVVIRGRDFNKKKWCNVWVIE